MRDHGAPTILLSQQVSINGLCNRANLVHLQQETVAGLLLDSCSNALGVGHSQVITHNLDVGAGGHLGPVFPVILMAYIKQVNSFKVVTVSILVYNYLQMQVPDSNFAVYGY